MINIKQNSWSYETAMGWHRIFVNANKHDLQAAQVKGSHKVTKLYKVTVGLTTGQTRWFKTVAEDNLCVPKSRRMWIITKEFMLSFAKE